jgi:hypothetical protein
VVLLQTSSKTADSRTKDDYANSAKTTPKTLDDHNRKDSGTLSRRLEHEEGLLQPNSTAVDFKIKDDFTRGALKMPEEPRSSSMMPR